VYSVGVGGTNRESRGHAVGLDAGGEKKDAGDSQGEREPTAETAQTSRFSNGSKVHGRSRLGNLVAAARVGRRAGAEGRGGKSQSRRNVEGCGAPNAQFSLGLAYLKPIRTRPGPGLELLVGRTGTRVITGRWVWGERGQPPS
jgi:hypothetical protein